MAAKILDGKKISAIMVEKARREVEQLKEKGKTIKFVVMQVGNDPASNIYVNKKHRLCLDIGIESEIKKYPKTIGYKEFLMEIGKLNKDPKVNGILVQTPLPEHLSHKKVFETIDIRKDCDGFHPYNHGKNLLGKNCLQPATPKGIIEMLDFEKIKLEGKHAVIIGRSNIVGKPLAMMLLNRDATVTICHSKTKNLSEITKQADILVSAVGKPKFVKAEMVKKGAIVIDVGINRLPNGKVVGDVDFENVKEKASWITPVPGGVGLMTVASVVQNVITAFRDQEAGEIDF